jgi:hypothetical protein
MRMLAYGVHGDAKDEYMCMSESTTQEPMKRFNMVMVEKIGPHLFRPNEDETARIMVQNEPSEIHGMLGSVDCIHWSWKTCPFYLASIVKMAS